VDDRSLYHFACSEVWHLAKFGKLPRLRQASTNDRNHYQEGDTDKGLVEVWRA
jgi:hypothetical protein